MFEGKEVLVLNAIAGSGKTSYLVDDIDRTLDVYLPEEVAFVTFTRKGAQEGLQRICEKRHLDADDLPYFRTLHSLTFHALDFQANQMFGGFEENSFNKEFGYNLNRVMVSKGQALPTRDSQYLDYYDLVRSGASTDFKLLEMDIDFGYYSLLVQNYEIYKSERHLVDFFDCLIKYVQEGSSLPCKVVYIDEVQDISLLQWKVIEKAFQKAEKIIVAGDTEQSIFTYAGARPEFLIELTKRFPVKELNTSYRLPKKVASLAKAVVDYIDVKTDKQFEINETKDEGSITRLIDVDSLKGFIRFPKRDRKKIQWMLLARNKCFLAEYVNMLEEQCIPYWTDKGFFICERDLQKLQKYAAYREDKRDSEKKRKFMLDYGITDFSNPVSSSHLFEGDRKYVYEFYLEEWGIDRLTEISLWTPQVLVSTIHFVKGAEAENVVLRLDITRRTWGMFYENLDEELRVLYVGITRTRQNLFLIDARSWMGYDQVLKTIEETNGIEI